MPRILPLEPDQTDPQAQELLGTLQAKLGMVPFPKARSPLVFVSNSPSSSRRRTAATTACPPTPLRAA